MAGAGVDAVIVRTWGGAAHSEMAPELVLHASTQMTITSAEGAELAGSLGVRRVVLARELSIREIAEIRRHTDLELEVFVHGALCVSYSGQCFSSEAWGGRSANRGQCAQACRLPYDLVLDGATHDLGPIRYLLSPHDLMAVDQCAAAGVHCFKIEGRLSPVRALTVKAIAAIDQAWAGRGIDDADERRDLAQIFPVGSPRVSSICQAPAPVRDEPTAPRDSRGHRAHDPRGVMVALDGPVKRGDGVVFDADAPRSKSPAAKCTKFRGRESLV
jgi:putative protease